MKNNPIGNIKSTIVNNSKSIKMNEKPVETDAVIKDLQEAAKSFKDYADINGYMDKLTENNPDCIKLDSNQYKYKDFYINTCLKFATDAHANGLMFGSRLALSCCPQFVDYISAQNGSEAVLITKIDGTKDANVVPYYDCRSDVPVEAKKNFMKDIDTLLQEGYSNMAIMKPNNWYVVPSTKRIIVADWANIFAFRSEEQKPKYKKILADAIGLIY